MCFGQKGYLNTLVHHSVLVEELFGVILPVVGYRLVGHFRLPIVSNIFLCPSPRPPGPLPQDMISGFPVQYSEN